ncbi:MAG: hypothetical protein WCF22_04415, partial [Candidatus Sulfotelmatobacter sp.]
MKSALNKAVPVGWHNIPIGGRQELGSIEKPAGWHIEGTPMETRFAKYFPFLGIWIAKYQSIDGTRIAGDQGSDDFHTLTGRDFGVDVEQVKSFDLPAISTTTLVYGHKSASIGKLAAKGECRDARVSAAEIAPVNIGLIAKSGENYSMVADNEVAGDMVAGDKIACLLSAGERLK